MALGERGNIVDGYKELESHCIWTKRMRGSGAGQKPENLAKSNSKEIVLSQELWEVMKGFLGLGTRRPRPGLKMGNQWVPISCPHKPFKASKWM